MKNIIILVMSLILWIGLTQNTMSQNYWPTGDTIDVFSGTYGCTFNVCYHGHGVWLKSGPVDDAGLYDWGFPSGSHSTYIVYYDPAIEGDFWYYITHYNSAHGSIAFYLNFIMPQTSTQNISICQGDSYTIGAHTYTSAGTYIDTIPAINTCDSIVTTHLSIIDYPTLTVSNDTIVCAGSSITLHASGTGTSFSWSTSATTQSISVMTDHDTTIWVSTSNVCGTVTDTVNITVYPTFSSTNVVEIDSGQSYIINGHIYTETGIYFDTLLTIHGCDSIIETNLTVITSVFAISQTGEMPVIYPNPANDKVTIIANKNGLIKIIDLNGRVIKSKNIENGKEIIDISELSGGVYSIQIMTDKGLTVKKLIKQ